MNDQQRTSRRISYMYSYPHKMAYHTFSSPVSPAPYSERLVRGQASLYSHIPFCVHKCGYRNLFSQQSCDGGYIPAYLHTMRRRTERLSMAAQDLRFTSFIVRGGTPLILNEKQLDELFCIAELFGVCPLEVFTPIETPPEYADKKVLQQLRTRGMERLSMGMQSLSDAELRGPKRRPVLAITVDALQNIQKADPLQLNLDLIRGVEEQTVDSFIHSLTTVLIYHPDGLFIYPLYVRPGTRINVRSTDNMCYAIYRSTRELLVERGFMQISMRCFVKRRTTELELSYGDETMPSCGSGGRSYLGDLHCVTSYAAWQEAIAEEIDRYTRTVDSLTVTSGYLLSMREVQIRFTIGSLMYYRGLDTAEYRRCFGKEPDRTLFREFTDREWVEEKSRALLLTEEGMAYSDYIGQFFISPTVRRLISEYIYP